MGLNPCHLSSGERSQVETTGMSLPLMLRVVIGLKEGTRVKSRAMQTFTERAVIEQLYTFVPPQILFSLLIDDYY